MNTTTAQDIGPDFSKFKSIPPAFAGTIIDWSIGSREITATIIDLILRDHLSIVNNTIINNKRQTTSINNFEKKFINTIFINKSSLSFDKFSEIVFRKEFDNLLKIIANGMLEEGFIDKDYPKKNITDLKKRIKKDFDELPANEKKRTTVNIVKSNNFLLSIGKHSKIISIIAIILLTLLFLFLRFSSLQSILLILLVPLAYLLIIILIPLLIIVNYFGNIYSLASPTMLIEYDKMLSRKGRLAKIESIKLKEYMKNNPLLEDRLANELVSFAIAFGLGKKLMNKLGRYNANMKLFIESLTSESATISYFFDWDSYLKSLENWKPY